MNFLFAPHEHRRANHTPLKGEGVLSAAEASTSAPTRQSPRRVRGVLDLQLSTQALRLRRSVCGSAARCSSLLLALRAISQKLK